MPESSDGDGGFARAKIAQHNTGHPFIWRVPDVGRAALREAPVTTVWSERRDLHHDSLTAYRSHGEW